MELRYSPRISRRNTGDAIVVNDRETVAVDRKKVLVDLSVDSLLKSSS